MKTKLLITALLASLLVVSNGCLLFVAGAAAGAGIGGYAWINGEIKVTEDASMDRTWSAVQAALKDLEYPVISQAKDALEGTVTARNASNTTISIKLKNLAKASTEIRIRVGTFGDEALSRTILNKINSHLQSGS
jgi:hypothetical protein